MADYEDDVRRLVLYLVTVMYLYACVPTQYKAYICFMYYKYRITYDVICYYIYQVLCWISLNTSQPRGKRAGYWTRLS